jgi:hypothetical protein
VATDDLHAPLGLQRPAAGRPIVHSVAAAALGIANAAVVIGAVAWYDPLSRSQPATSQTTPTQAAAPVVIKPDPAVTASAPSAPRVQVPAVAPPSSRPQVTGTIPPAATLDGGKAQEPAAPASTDRIITIIDGRSGARQEVRIPATSDALSATPPDAGLADLLRGGTVLGADDDVPEPITPPHAKSSAPPKRARPAASTNSASQAPPR